MFCLASPHSRRLDDRPRSAFQTAFFLKRQLAPPGLWPGRENKMYLPAGNSSFFHSDRLLNVHGYCSRGTLDLAVKNHDLDFVFTGIFVGMAKREKMMLFHPAVAPFPLDALNRDPHTAIHRHLPPLHFRWIQGELEINKGAVTGTAAAEKK